ncbi:MAG: PadR family transcriptional regulator, regulatory protein PadR [Actinoplanes sp.]|jgi:DNA-binding PadR family transcriptional regulator|nr:PadR family transcriptional regulator, regulatory protein PadR [Actinoplanes sp.]
MTISPLRTTTAVSLVLAAFLEDPEARRYGLDLIRASGNSSGTLYPILLRLRRAGWVEATWEAAEPDTAGRLARRHYRLTVDGALEARSA